MLPNTQRNIIIRVLQIRKDQGEEPADALEDYKNLTDEERTELSEALEEQGR